jgi:hypothetical protein
MYIPIGIDQGIPIEIEQIVDKFRVVAKIINDLINYYYFDFFSSNRL